MKDFTYLGDIKGTAMNKGRARVWLEKAQSELCKFGFLRGEPVDIVIGESAITVRVDSHGKRKVAGRVKKDGKVICILDICFPAEKRLAMFAGADRLQVWAGNCEIVICAANIPAIQEAF